MTAVQLYLMQLSVAAGIREISEFRVVESSSGLVFTVNTLLSAEEAIGGDEITCVLNDDEVQALARHRFPHTWDTYNNPFGLFYVDAEFDGDASGVKKDWDESDAHKLISTYIAEDMPGAPFSEEDIANMFTQNLLTFEKFTSRGLEG